MPAISFQGEWLDKLLSGSKRQITRPQTDRIKEGAVCNIYNQPRIMIRDKPLRLLTKEGIAMMPMARYPFPSNNPPTHYAHLLGKVKIAEVYDIHPCEMIEAKLKAWAVAEGFKGFHPAAVLPDRLYDGANIWFQQHYGDDWMQRWWTVIGWDDWIERYFTAIDVCRGDE